MVKQKQKSKASASLIVVSAIAVVLFIFTLCLALSLAEAREHIDYLENENRDCNSSSDDGGGSNEFVVKKPLIYLYPTNDMRVSVKLGNDDRLTSSYPKYTDGWEVFAKKDGTLMDSRTGRSLYGLYWEGSNYPAVQTDEGFIVAAKDSVDFLETKLAQLGLTEREANEMIIYWLPQLEKNAYNYIRFDTNEVMDEYMPLNISPKPDSVIRVSMVFKGLEKPISVNEQVFPVFERDGFTVVEWGGSEIK